MDIKKILKEDLNNSTNKIEKPYNGIVLNAQFYKKHLRDFNNYIKEYYILIGDYYGVAEYQKVIKKELYLFLFKDKSEMLQFMTQINIKCKRIADLI